MARLDRIRKRRRTLAVVAAAAIAVSVGVGPSPALAAKKPATPVASPVSDASGGLIYRNGRYSPLDTVDGLLTVHLAINNRGQTAGPYVRSLEGLGDLGGFVRSQRGDYTRFDVAPGPSTWPTDINDHGTVVGVSGNPETLEGGSFLRRPGGEITTVVVPGTSSTSVSGINNRGAMVGNYLDADGMDHAFLMDRGRVTTLLPPDAAVDPAAFNVVAYDVNDQGQVVGCYADANGTYHGFRYDTGRFTRIDPPGGADIPIYATTCAFGINNRGQVAGQYVDAAGVLHGYLWQRGRGFKTIDPPRGAPMVGPTGIRGTIAADINDRGDILLPSPGTFYKGRAVPIGG